MDPIAAVVAAVVGGAAAGVAVVAVTSIEVHSAERFQVSLRRRCRDFAYCRIPLASTRTCRS